MTSRCAQLVLIVGARSQAWILTALHNGYRHLDTAYGYHTKKKVGNAFRESGISTEEIFVTTKLLYVVASRPSKLPTFFLPPRGLYLMH